jgi:hypothetical protein
VGDRRLLKQSVPAVVGMLLAGVLAMGDTARVLDGLRQESPDDISGDRDTLVEAVQSLVDAVHATGAVLDVCKVDLGSGLGGVGWGWG